MSPDPYAEFREKLAENIRFIAEHYDRLEGNERYIVQEAIEWYAQQATVILGYDEFAWAFDPNKPKEMARHVAAAIRAVREPQEDQT